MKNLEFKDFKKTRVKEHDLEYNPHYKKWECIKRETGRVVTSATTKTECFLKAIKLFKGTHNFIWYGQHLTKEEEERDLRNACYMHVIDMIIEEAA